MLDASSNRISSPQLFLIFSRIGLTSFGGGLSGWLLREFVQSRKWLTEEEFFSGLAISQGHAGHQCDQHGDLDRLSAPR
jgi:chromate transporter